MKVFDYLWLKNLNPDQEVFIEFLKDSGFYLKFMKLLKRKYLIPHKNIWVDSDYMILDYPMVCWDADKLCNGSMFWHNELFFIWLLNDHWEKYCLANQSQFSGWGEREEKRKYLIEVSLGFVK